MTNTSEDLIELYAAANQIEGDRLVLLLGEDGVEAMARATTSTSFPTGGAVLILVAAHDVDKARATIENARREGAVTHGGDFTAGR